MFRKIRIVILLLILVFVAANTYLDRRYTRDWNSALQVALYAVNADGSAAATDQLAALSNADLQPLESFFDEQAKQYDLAQERPLRFVWAPTLTQAPPLPPEAANPLAIMWWSLQLRWYAWRAPDPTGPTPIIKLFLLYHDPARNSVLPHSTGLEKGKVGIAHLFASADMRRANQVIVAHELLHTLGATDKYDLDTNLPLYPEGYADPEQSPRYPQTAAELMAGRIAISERHAEQAESLQQVVIGPLTAREIGWIAE